MRDLEKYFIGVWAITVFEYQTGDEHELASALEEALTSGDVNPHSIHEAHDGIDKTIEAMRRAVRTELAGESFSDNKSRREDRR